MNKKSSVPSRKELRQLLQPYEVKNNLTALRLFITDYSLFFLGQYLVIVMPFLFKPFGSAISAVAIMRLFLLGHDAVHNSLTDSKKLNKWLGILVFLPSMIPYKAWGFTHNMVHHGFTNLVSKKDSWHPISPITYQELSEFEKFCYRIYRSKWGSGFYYAREIWWKNLYFPSDKVIRKKSFFDSFVVSVFLGLWLIGLSFFASIVSQSLVVILCFGFLLPFGIWNVVAGFLFYLNHTHPKVAWYQDQSEWANSAPYITVTPYVHLPQWIGTILHSFTEHLAHHLDMNIPCYNLRLAQCRLMEELPEEAMVIQDFSWSWYLECTRVCKLYDFEKHEWVGFPE